MSKINRHDRAFRLLLRDEPNAAYKIRMTLNAIIDQLPENQVDAILSKLPAGKKLLNEAKGPLSKEPNLYTKKQTLNRIFLGLGVSKTLETWGKAAPPEVKKSAIKKFLSSPLARKLWKNLRNAAKFFLGI